MSWSFKLILQALQIRGMSRLEKLNNNAYTLLI